MKHLAAILFSGLLLFNVYGYRMVLSYLEKNAELCLELKLDQQQYAEEDLINIKIPTSLPYYTNNKDLERIDGEVTIEGMVYKYVKRRIYNDSLELLCIPHPDKVKWQAAKENFVRMNTDAALPEQDKKGPVTILKISLPEYCQTLTYFHFLIESTIDLNRFPNAVAFLQRGITTILEQPPDFIAAVPFPASYYF